MKGCVCVQKEEGGEMGKHWGLRHLQDAYLGKDMTGGLG